MNIEIKKAGVEDFDTLIELNDGLVDFENTIVNDFYSSTWNKTEQGKNIFKHNLLSSFNTNVFIAYDEDRPIGYIIGALEERTWRIKSRVGIIRHIFVVDDYRNKGIGKILMNSVMNYFQQNNRQTIKVDVLAQNAKAVNFYEGFGFGEIVKSLEKDI